MQLNTERFDEQFGRFKQLIKTASGRDFVGFNEGLAAEWEESTKFRFGKRRCCDWILSTGSPTQSETAVLEAAIRAVEIEKTEKKNPKNNLVRWENIFGHAS